MSEARSPQSPDPQYQGQATFLAMETIPVFPLSGLPTLRTLKYIMTRQFFRIGILCCILFHAGSPILSLAQAPTTRPLTIEPMTSILGLAEWDWTQARTTFVPGTEPISITTMSRTRQLGSHGYYDIYESISNDHGRTWSAPRLIPSLSRHQDDDGYEVAAGDLWPTYHPATHKVIVTGKTFNFANGRQENFLKEKVAYAVKSLQDGRWGPLKTMDMPSLDHSGASILAANAGCNQPFVLPGGDLLLPIRYQRTRDQRVYTSVIARCRFDGEQLVYVEHGTEHSIARDRGLYEPSVIAFKGRYYLTLRADHAAYVTRGQDGLHYDPVKEWRFDDGDLLGSYNTQQHWVHVGDQLYLVYTRLGADNDHVFRHRAPLFIARVDPERLVVIRKTERVLLPENHACLGNSGICRIGDLESWVTCGEVRVSYGKRKGEANKVLFSRMVAD